jgi:hypothetical protein
MWAIILTAVLSALLTTTLLCAVAWYAYQHRLRGLIETEVQRRVDQYGELIEQRVRNGIVKAVDDVTSVEALQKSVTKSQDTFLNALFGVPAPKRD